MTLLPNSLIEKLREFLNLFTTPKFKGSNYKEIILNLAESDEEKSDLEELFQNTSDFYAEKSKIKESGLNPSDYLKDLYLKTWKEENPGASEEELKQAELEYEEVLSDAVIKELEALDKESISDDSENIFDFVDENETEDSIKPE